MEAGLSLIAKCSIIFIKLMNISPCINSLLNKLHRQPSSICCRIQRTHCRKWATKKTPNTVVFVKHLPVSSRVCDSEWMWLQWKMNTRLRASSRLVLKGLYYRGRGRGRDSAGTNGRCGFRSQRTASCRGQYDGSSFWERLHDDREKMEVIKVVVCKSGAATEEWRTRIGKQDVFMAGSEFTHLNSAENEV